jgi:hypothetical protein
LIRGRQPPRFGTEESPGGPAGRSRFRGRGTIGSPLTRGLSVLLLTGIYTSSNGYDPATKTEKKLVAVE